MYQCICFRSLFFFWACVNSYQICVAGFRFAAFLVKFGQPPSAYALNERNETLKAVLSAMIRSGDVDARDNKVNDNVVGMLCSGVIELVESLTEQLRFAAAEAEFAYPVSCQVCFVLSEYLFKKLR